MSYVFFFFYLFLARCTRGAACDVPRFVALVHGENSVAVSGIVHACWSERRFAFRKSYLREQLRAYDCVLVIARVNNVSTIIIMCLAVIMHFAKRSIYGQRATLSRDPEAPRGVHKGTADLRKDRWNLDDVPRRRNLMRDEGRVTGHIFIQWA